jgi:hypothetical protein
MSLVFAGHTDVGGGLSGAAGAGNIGGTFKTNYQMNYN